MANPRKYGKAPYSVVVVHGGPGAAGDMADVAKTISAYQGVLEPLQNGMTVKEQVQELAGMISAGAAAPVTLIGHSWGAWLSMMLAARHPHLVKKLILISSGPFEEKDAVDIHVTRMNRMDEKEREEIEMLFDVLNDPKAKDRDEVLARMGRIMSRTDSYKPEKEKAGSVRVNAAMFSAVWQEAMGMRATGELTSILSHVKCPVTAIHGDYDPHPAAGVERPLKKAVKNSKFILIKNCGHYPWKEKEARAEFYRVIKSELREN